MILDAHVDITSGNKQKVLCDIANGAQKAGFKVNFVRCCDINIDHYSLLWRYPNQGEKSLHNIINKKDAGKLFFVNGNYFKSYHINNNQRSLSNNDYYRIMWRSIYDNEGTYPDKPNNLISQFYSDHNFNIKPWKRAGNTILIVPNKVATFGCNGLNVEQWIDRQIALCYNEGYKEIVLQIHPMNDRLNIKHKVAIEKGDIKNTFKKYDIKFAILYNSGACTECLIEGIPIFVKGPNSPAKEFSNMQNMSNINYNVDREQYITEASKKMWHIQDIINGLPWINLREKL